MRAQRATGYSSTVMSESSKASALPAPLLELCQAELGRLSRISFCGWAHAESQVWEVQAASGKRAFLKQHRQPRKFEQERRAFEDWLPTFGEQVPRLLAARLEPPRTLLLSALPGGTLETRVLAPKLERLAYAQAGDFLRRFHHLSFQDDDPVPLEEALSERLAAWLERGRGVVDAGVAAWVRGRLLEALPLVAGLKRVPAHRDFTARNWLWHREKLYVIDFEHARPDLWLLDLERLWSGVWPRRPDLREAFLSGYERALSADEEALLGRLAAFAAFQTVVWAREHGDAAFERQGWRVLGRLRAQRSS